MKKISQSKKSRAWLAAFLVLGIVSSCARTETSTDPLGLPVSDAALLDDSERATPVIDDAAVFSDLNAQPADSESVISAATDASSSSSSSPFYNPIGGESLGRVAYTLYGDRKMFKTLLEQNPELRGTKALAASQRVLFDFDRVKPVPTFLTKDLLNRYPSELAAKISGSTLPQTTATLAPGETLQSLSQRLYGTTRYWTEIYLLNQASISNYDRVPAGVALAVVDRPMVGNVARPITEAPALVAQPEQAPEQPAVAPLAPLMQDAPTQQVAQPVIPAEPLNTPAVTPSIQPEAAAPTPVDPIPESTPTFQESLAQPVPSPEGSQEAVAASPEISQESFATSANIRRMVYVGLILLIGVLAFFLTRSKKKTFDMLDVTANDTPSGRPKLAPKDTQRQDIG